MEETEQVNPTEMQERVRQVFEQYPETKNSKKDLMRRYWQMYDNLGGVIDYQTWLCLTPGGSITRAGRHRQNNNDEEIRAKYEPTKKVKRIRKQKQKDMHETYKHKKTTIFGGVKREEVQFGR